MKNLARLTASLSLSVALALPLASCSHETEKPPVVYSSSIHRESGRLDKVEIDLELDTIPKECELYLSHLEDKVAAPAILLGRAPQKTKIIFIRHGKTLFPESYGIIALGPNKEKSVTMFFPVGYMDRPETLIPYFSPIEARRIYNGREAKFPFRKTIRVQLNPFGDQNIAANQNLYNRLTF